MRSEATDIIFPIALISEGRTLYRIPGKFCAARKDPESRLAEDRDSVAAVVQMMSSLIIRLVHLIRRGSGRCILVIGRNSSNVGHRATTSVAHPPRVAAVPQLAWRSNLSGGIG